MQCVHVCNRHFHRKSTSVPPLRYLLTRRYESENLFHSASAFLDNGTGGTTAAAAETKVGDNDGYHMAPRYTSSSNEIDRRNSSSRTAAPPGQPAKLDHQTDTKVTEASWHGRSEHSQSPGNRSYHSNYQRSNHNQMSEPGFDLARHSPGSLSRQGERRSSNKLSTSAETSTWDASTIFQYVFVLSCEFFYMRILVSLCFHDAEVSRNASLKTD